MEPTSPSLREQGMQALKEGNLDRAVDYLARAVMADDNDVESKALLGIAYSQKGLHAQAKRALQTAVEREPQNVNHRFNLGIVCERAGDLQGAAVAFRDTLDLNPQHPQARGKLQQIPNSAQILANAPKATGPVGVPTYSQGSEPQQAPAPPPQPAYTPPPPPAMPPPPAAAPPAYTPPAPPAYAPPQPQAPAPPPQQYQPPQAPAPAPQAYQPPQAPSPYPSAPSPAQFGSAPSPYANSGAVSSSGGFQQPHRGGLMLGLGIGSLVLTFCLGCSLPGIIGWILAAQDLKAMASGVMDRSGEGQTKGGMWCSIASVALSLCLVPAYVLLMMTMNGGGR